MRLLVGGGLPISGGIVGARGESAWPRPVRPGAVLHVESEILELRPSRSRPGRGVATVRSETHDQVGEVVQRLVVKLVVPRRMLLAAGRQGKARRRPMRRQVCPKAVACAYRFHQPNAILVFVPSACRAGAPNLHRLNCACRCDRRRLTELRCARRWAKPMRGRS